MLESLCGFGFFWMVLTVRFEARFIIELLLGVELFIDSIVGLFGLFGLIELIGLNGGAILYVQW